MQQLTKTKSQFEPNIAYYVGMDILFDSIGYIVCVCVCVWLGQQRRSTIKSGKQSFVFQHAFHIRSIGLRINKIPENDLNLFSSHLIYRKNLYLPFGVMYYIFRVRENYRVHSRTNCTYRRPDLKCFHKHEAHERVRNGFLCIHTHKGT